MYEIADPGPLPARPNLPGTVVLRATPDEAIDAAAADVLIHATNCVRAFGDFHAAVALEGGSEDLVRRLMYDPVVRDLPWKRTHLWLVDEFAVPEHDPLRRSTALRELLVEPSDIPLGQVHVIDTQVSAPDEAYEAQVREHLGWREKGHDRLDYVLLGLSAVPTRARKDGDRDGASSRSERLVTVVPGGADGRAANRVTMTERLVAAARLIGVVATGEAFRRSLSAAAARDAGGLAPHEARRVLYSARGPLGGELRWYIDAAACPALGGLGA